ncbi:MAG: aspartate aminotransferase family protein [Caldilineales bacterium]|nr:aspartate aminotransferase family protein [Caldilineales bacterium]
MAMQGPKTKALYERAKEKIPYGVNSNFRYWGDDDTLIIARGEGAYVWDVDGKRYIDYRLGFGPVILGHAYPSVIENVRKVVADGSVFAWTTPGEVELAERITRMTGVEMVRLSNTGTEATMHAQRLARSYTGRERYIKFEGAYHGMYDYALFSTASSNSTKLLGSRRSPRPAPASAGIPRRIDEYVIPLPYNDFEKLEETVAAHWHELAFILFEPIMGNAASIMPAPGFLEKIRELCDKYGIIMIMDEVKTGFRVANGGAQAYFGVEADLLTYAKAMGNGFPIAAIGGKRDILMSAQPGVFALGGTYTGNMVGVAAANATLKILENEPVIETINTRGEALMGGIAEILTRFGLPYQVFGPPPMFGVVISEKQPNDFRDFIASDTELSEAIFMELNHRGVQPDADNREPWFLCYSLSEADVAETLQIFEDSVTAVMKTWTPHKRSEAAD